MKTNIITALEMLKEHSKKNMTLCQAKNSQKKDMTK